MCILFCFTFIKIPLTPSATILLINPKRKNFHCVCNNNKKRQGRKWEFALFCAIQNAFVNWSVWVMSYCFSTRENCFLFLINHSFCSKYYKIIWLPSAKVKLFDSKHFQYRQFKPTKEATQNGLKNQIAVSCNVINFNDFKFHFESACNFLCRSRKKIGCKLNPGQFTVKISNPFSPQ